MVRRGIRAQRRLRRFTRALGRRFPRRRAAVARSHAAGLRRSGLDGAAPARGAVPAGAVVVVAAVAFACYRRGGRGRCRGVAAAEGRGIGLGQNSERGRDGITGAREEGKIGFASLRGGSVVGEHDVIFAAENERIVLRHIAEDRSIFARGALKAAQWGQGSNGKKRGPGLFDMADVLGIE